MCSVIIIQKLNQSHNLRKKQSHNLRKKARTKVRKKRLKNDPQSVINPTANISLTPNPMPPPNPSPKGEGNTLNSKTQ